MSEQTDKYLRHAEEARQNAKKCDRDADKQSWLKIAEAWLQLAQEAQKPSF